MSGVSETRVIGKVLTATLASIKKVLNDNVFDDYVLLSWLNGKLGRAMGKSIKDHVRGGESIIENVEYGVNSTVSSYAGADVIDTTMQDNQTIARYFWKQYGGTMGLTGLEAATNQGKEAVLRLITVETNNLVNTMRDTMNIDAFSDGTNNNAKSLTGLEALVSATSTLAGIAPGTFPVWKSIVESSVGSFAANGLTKMRSTFNSLSYGNNKPDFIVTTQSIFESYENLAQPIERITNAAAADLGFQNFAYKGVPMFFDRDCTSGNMYMLNSRHLRFVVHPDVEMKIGEFQEPDNQDVMSAKVLWYGNLTTGERRKHGKLTGIT